MAESNWRTVTKKNRGERNDNWRSRDDSEENVTARSGFFSNTSRDRNNFRKPFQASTNEPKRTNTRSNSSSQDSIVSNDLLNPQFLNDLCENQGIEKITTFLISNTDVYIQTLASDISEESLIALLKLAAKACENTFITSKSYMLKGTLQKKFVDTLCSFLSGLVIDDQKDSEFWRNFGNVLDNILFILENAMQFIPMTTWEYLQTIVKTITLILPVLRKDKNIPVSEEFEGRMATLQNDIIKIENKFKKLAPIVKNEDNLESEEIDPEDDFRFINLYPNSQELTVPERPYIRKNIVKGPYTSIQQYLDIHFRLMREDFLNPIREDICDYVNNSKRHYFNIKIYRDVLFLKKEIQKNMVCFEVQFQISAALQNMLQNGENKRFMHGTLLFFSRDNFKSFFCGKVVNTDQLKNGTLFVDLPSENQVDYTKRYSMIECVIFFKPYYQVLNVFQTLPRDKLPMEKYILKVDANTSYPKYMENVRRLNFPQNLNTSQVEALNAALHKEFVIIQGPPGTGKTFLGMKLVKMLLDQKKFWKESGPILVICFTNHALEQFLDGLSEFTDKLVRLGRNSTDLRRVDLKYGPITRLRTILEAKLIYEIYDDHEFDKHFNGLVRNINSASWRFTHKKSPLYVLSFDSIPLEIKKWISEKNDLSTYFRRIKDSEHDIELTKDRIQEIFNTEKYQIFVVTNEDNVVEYDFQNVEFFCWLLCDDGTILAKQTNGVDVPKDNISEQDRIYYLLCNFVLGEENLNYFYVNDLKKTALELSSYLKNEHHINPAERMHLQETLDFFLTKIDYLKFCLEADFGPPEVEFDNFPDPFMIQVKHRWQLYKHWIEMYKNTLRQSLEKKYAVHQRLCDTYNDLREMDNVKLLREMDIVGMTTTCAARLRSTLEALKSPIVVVEEAAEILESHVVTALTNDCQHLILLGDHQQLRPTTSDYTIGKKYKLGISLFERMVQNNVECHTLNVQHRMRPEISSLICPLFYKELFNHKSVEEYPSVSGIENPLYFIDHMEPEELYGDSSKMNMHEAKFLIQLAIYLLNNNYKPHEITILAAYLGQSYILKKEQEKSSHPKIKEVRVTVVDNFQGEENKIILLSLVRSNRENNVGFLSIDNRVCVALSRAKVGFYIMGNMTLLCEATDIWKSVRDTLASQNSIGRYLPLRCKNHKEHTTLVSKATDFANVPEGGCNQVCNAILECGHNCIKICHGYDRDHKLYNCKEPCSRFLCYNTEHKCKKLCFDQCGPCLYPVNRRLPCGHEKNLSCFIIFEKYKCMEMVEIHPECGHVQNAPCSTEVATFKCLETVDFQPDCGHSQNIPCYTKVEIDRKRNEVQIQDETTPNFSFKCKVLREKAISKCGHTQMVPCCEDVETFQCQFQMEIILKCGHKREKLCYLEEIKIKCSVICDKTLPCGHKCPLICHINDDPNHFKYQCKEPCTKNLRDCNNPEVHQKCKLLCYERCPPCKKILIKSYDSCSHIEQLECHEATPSRKCNKPCAKKLTCGHLCQNKCFQPCSSCMQKTFKIIPECGHKIKILCLKTPMHANCTKMCTKILECGHGCDKRCAEPCNKMCRKQCRKTLDCGHKCITRCNESCACKSEVLPRCGHTVLFKCGEIVSENCKKPCRKTLDCGHTYIMPCNQSILEFICEQSSPRTLSCGHRTFDICSKSTANIKCYERCQKNLECGHPCQSRCSQPCTPMSKCLFPCEKLLSCSHKCEKKCYQTCTETCLNECEKILQCGHKCTNTCSSECIAVCETECRKKLACGHHCPELCGKPCADTCQRRCKKMLQCGHRCYQKCLEPCATVCKSKCAKLLGCGHECEELCGQPCTLICQKPCRKILECGHSCKETCVNPCTSPSRCDKICRKILPCNHNKCTNLCNQPCVKCTKKCTKKLDCGHTCINKCHEECACSIVKSTDCLHYVRAKCGETPTKINCWQLCNKVLACGHQCKERCNEECKCRESCRKRLKCGCFCIKLTCSEPCECRNRCYRNEEE